jgi:rod shape-determining protein MreB
LINSQICGQILQFHHLARPFNQNICQTRKRRLVNGKNEEEKYSVIRGRDLETGLPKSIKISAAEIREALSPVIIQIISAIKDLIEETPPELVSDLLNRGIAMAGGGSLLRHIDLAISEATKMPVWIADDPLTAVVRGTGKVLVDDKLLARVRVTGGLK